MYYESDESIKLLTAFQAIAAHEAKRQRTGRTAHPKKQRAGIPVSNPLDVLLKLDDSKQRAASENVGTGTLECDCRATSVREFSL